MDPATVAKMAQLSAIELQANELTELGARFEELVAYFAKLGELDALPEPGEGFAGQTLTSHASGERADESRPGLAPELFLEQAPASSGFAFKVPRIIG